jgi:nitrite reductase/ring-hydroxylating ferredoxin subunit
MRELCGFDELADPGSRGFEIEQDGATRRLFVVRKGDAVYGYVNSCPHARLPLNWRPDTFLSYDKRTIQCAMHMAQFVIETGACHAGPCEDHGLVPAPVALRDGKVVLTGPVPVAPWEESV